MQKIILAALAAIALAAAPARGESTCSVTVTKFHQSYPYSGKATVEYTVATSATLPANAVAEFTISTDDASATFVQSNIVAGANSHVIDFASSFGGALILTNASFTVTIAAEAGADLGGVQLWEGGPYWAECNVGASAPEESGYYFWWGDTVGYTNTGSGWISVKDGTSISFFSSGTAASTYGKSVSTLQSEGWIDSSGNLTAAHDAATAHLGAPWRMPTDAEHSALINNCDWTWTAKNGVNGYEVRGRGDYANRSIFLPAAGYGRDSSLYSPGSHGDCWSSTSYSGYSYDAWYLYFHSGDFDRDYYYHGRYYGQSVRPVRGFAGCSAGGVVTYDAPIIIESVAVWNEFCAAVADGLETEGVVVLLANDVGPVSTTVGTAEHPFAGVFDGGSNTLTVALSGSDRAIAPFSAISGATIRNLKVEGTVSCAIHCSGLVGEVFGGPNLIEGCEVAAAITCSASHFGGFIGHSVTYAATLRGCVFSGSLFGGTYVATFNGWSDDGAATTLIDCLDASTSAQPIGRGTDAECVSNTLYFASKDFSNGERLWSEGTRGGRAYTVTGSEGVALDFGTPSASYGGSGLAVHPAGLAHGGALYAEAGATVALSPAFTGTPPAGKKHDGFAASAGELAQSGEAWVLTMPAGDVSITATFADTVEISFDANGGSGAPASESYIPGKAYGPLPSATRVGYTFAGWFTAADGGTQVTAVSTVPASATTLHAHWTANQYVVTLIGGPESVTATYGEPMPTIAVPTLPGRVFDGYVDGCGTQYYTASGASARNWDKTDATTLYSRWTLIQYAVTLDGQGGTGGTESVTVEYDYPMPTITVPTRPGYEFRGYYTGVDGGGTKYYKASGESARNWDLTDAATLYAKWAIPGVHNKVQLWEGGPYWAETNVGAGEPEDYGLYFWWGDTVGYRWEDNAWAASDGSTSNFSFKEGNAPTYGKDGGTLQSEGWITDDDSSHVLAPAHDAARAHWGGDWRMPTYYELAELRVSCDWTWTTTNGVSGYVVRGRGEYSAASIFLPAAGSGSLTDRQDAGRKGNYWSSLPANYSLSDANDLGFDSSGYISIYYYNRYYGHSVRPVQSSPTAYDIWAAANGVAGAWDATDANGVHNVFRYAFDKPTGAFENPPLLSIHFENGSPVVVTPPLVNTDGYFFALLAYDALTNAVPSEGWQLSPDGTNAVPGNLPARFFRLWAEERNPNEK